MNQELLREAMSLFHKHHQIGVEMERREAIGLYDLPGHPFGLPLLTNPLPVFGPTNIRWSNRGTDLSCATMCLYLSTVVERPHTDFGLRIIKVRIPDGRHMANPGAPCHDYFFEFGTSLYAIIVGACTDHSGTGSRGMQTLDTVFRGFAELYGRSIEETTVSPEAGRHALSGVEHWLKKQVA